MNAAILRYSLIPDEFPCALYEAAYAVRYLREHAKEWDCDPDKIIIAGFSAGGHVAASLGTMWNSKELEGFVKEYLHTEPEMIRPDGMLLGYPVITSGEKAHRKSFERLLGTRYEQLLESVSLEERVTKDTPQTFLWHTVTDGAVPVENSMLFAQALQKEHIGFELHLFPHGNHGLGLGTRETDTADGTHFSRKYPSAGIICNVGGKFIKRMEIMYESVIQFMNCLRLKDWYIQSAVIRWSCSVRICAGMVCWYRFSVPMRSRQRFILRGEKSVRL